MVSYSNCSNLHVINDTTIAVTRQDYANIYHTVTDLYSAYLLCRFVQQNPKSVRILFLDAHPSGALDALWSRLFHSYTRLGRLNHTALFYRQLIWSQAQWQSELDVTRMRKTAPSFFAQFRQHTLEQYQVNTESRSRVNCQSVKVFFLLRRNYVAHPRNPSGRVVRQLTNEKQIVDDLTKRFANSSAVQLTFGHFDQLEIQQQLSTIASTDLFIGMHGAGLTHVLFMASNRSLIELATPSFQTQPHFEVMAAINSIHYRRCLIQDHESSTSQTIHACMKESLERMCPPNDDAQSINAATATSIRNDESNATRDTTRS